MHTCAEGGSVVGKVAKQTVADATPTVNVVIIDDHEVVRCGLRQVVESSPHRLVGEAATAAKALAVCRQSRPDVVVLDVRLEDAKPGGAGASFELIGRIRQLLPHANVIVFSAFDHPGYVARAMAAGAHDFLVKGEPAEVIVDAIEGAAVGRTPRRATALRRVVGMMAHRSVVDDGDSPLTSRELQVLREIVAGLSNMEIAGQLSISVETVKEHVQNLLRKLAVNDRTQAAIWAIRQGLA